VPVLVHVEEVTQPQGHSTSGSHERYKSKERLQWELDFDCVKKMREFIIQNALADDATLNTIEEDSKNAVRTSQKAAWTDYLNPIKSEVAEVSALFDELSNGVNGASIVSAIKTELNAIKGAYSSRNS
jgi:2-oxoisovalerate dehydrogenase E1 component